MPTVKAWGNAGPHGKAYAQRLHCSINLSVKLFVCCRLEVCRSEGSAAAVIMSNRVARRTLLHLLLLLLLLADLLRSLVHSLVHTFLDELAAKAARALGGSGLGSASFGKFGKTTEEEKLGISFRRIEGEHCVFVGESN
jgi:hypothetical protein